MGQVFQPVQLIMLGGETSLRGNPVIEHRNRACEGRGQSVFRVSNRMHQAIAGLPQPGGHVCLELQSVHGLGNRCGHAGLFVGFCTTALVWAYRPGRWHIAAFRIGGEYPLHQPHATDAVNHRVVHFGVKGKTVIIQAFNNVAFPKRAGKIQGVRVQPGYQNAQFALTAGAGQG